MCVYIYVKISISLKVSELDKKCEITPEIDVCTNRNNNNNNEDDDERNVGSHLDILFIFFSS